jgi:hypothetical protein
MMKGNSNRYASERKGIEVGDEKRKKRTLLLVSIYTYDALNDRARVRHTCWHPRRIRCICHRLPVAVPVNLFGDEVMYVPPVKRSMDEEHQLL